MRPPMPALSLSRRSRIALAVVGILIVLLILANSFVGIYIDWLWFGEVGYRGVYRGILSTRLVLFVAFGLIMALVVGANLTVAYRLRPPFRPLSPEQQNLERYRVAVEPRKRLVLAALMVVSFLGAGLAAQANWRPWMLYRYGGTFGQKDPQFGRDISFFAWDYPVYRIVLGFAFSAVIFSLLLSVAMHYLFGAIRLQTPGPKITLSARRHVTVIVFVFIVLKAVAYWLDRYGLAFSNRGRVTGASYTDVNASLPAKTILFWIAIIIAAGVLASIWFKSAQLPLIGFVVLLVLSIVINGIYPALVQQFTVKPNAASKEAKYISRNITATRQAYDVVTNTATGTAAPNGTVTYETYDIDSTPSNTALSDTSSPTIANLRILDPNVVSPTFLAKQKLRSIYGFNAKLDVDRYTLPAASSTGSTADVTKDYIVGVRELNQAGLTGDQTNWINKHTNYTHGYGFVAAAADSDITAQGASFTEGDIPPSGALTINQPDVYYGELADDYAIVGAEGAPQEFAPTGTGKTRYAGSGGVHLSNILTRAAFALKYKETNFLLNNAVSAKGAKIIFVRDPRARVQKVAPFLKIDGDPYAAVVNGRIVWIVDGYTTMSNYPYSEQNSLSDLTSDSLSVAGTTARQPDDKINYIRNSVKATVDAYDGTVNLYQWDDQDPILKTWSKAFPGLIKPRSAMPADVLAHVRYPQDLFEVQRSVLQQYHVTDPIVFYNVGEKWTVPSDPYAPTTANQPPYYVLADAQQGASTSASFQLTTPMKVNNSQNLAAYISVDSDAGPNYGRMTVLQPTNSATVNGPEQVANDFKTQAAISKDVSLLDTGGSTVIHGNLLTLPIGKSFLYVEPLYVSGNSAGSYPTLQRVEVEYGGKIGYAATLAEALNNLNQTEVGISLVAGQTTTTTPPSTTPPPSSSGPSTTPSGPTSSSPATTANQVLLLLQQDQAALDAAYQTGDPVKIGAAVKKQTADLTRYLQLNPPKTAAPTSPTPTPTK